MSLVEAPEIRIDRWEESGYKPTPTIIAATLALYQNVHHFRDECLVDAEKPPIEHVAIFDEAHRAWNLKQPVDFMRRKKGRADFSQSEPEFLISCLDRHGDWAVVICLVGGGQEINTGEAGISEWLSALDQSFPDWRIYVSDRLVDSAYDAGRIVDTLRTREPWSSDRTFTWPRRFDRFGARTCRSWSRSSWTWSSVRPVRPCATCRSVTRSR